MPNRQTGVTDNESLNQGISGTWSTFASDHEFGTSVLIANFEKTGQYTLIWVGPLPSTPQENGTQPTPGTREEGKYHVQGNTLYLDPLGGDATVGRRLTISLPRKDVLVLNLDGFHIFNFMKCQRTDVALVK
jgi:hypothetical protein